MVPAARPARLLRTVLLLASRAALVHARCRYAATRLTSAMRIRVCAAMADAVWGSIEDLAEGAARLAASTMPKNRP